MTDEELDRDWKPNGRRPQSTIARSFSLELMDIFRIENSVADLDEQVDKRKQQLNNQTTELEELEARIREMEQRLKGQPGLDGLLSGANGRTGGSPRTQRPPVAGVFEGSDAPPPLPDKDPQRPNSQHSKYGGRRPGTARESQQAVPGALPPTPVGSEGEYEPVAHVPRKGLRSPTQARPRGAIAGAGISSLSSSTARFKAHSGDDSGSVKSMSDSMSMVADYVVVSRADGDVGEKDV
ncbi:hypothetical protein OQA88_11229 [Cercophora sp. LCS_1]